jgi:hypothetical protein
MAPGMAELHVPSLYGRGDNFNAVVVLQTLLSLYGTPATDGQCALLHINEGKRTRKINMLDMLSLMEALKVTADGMMISVDDLQNVKLPVLTLIGHDEDRRFAVINAFDAQGVSIFDARRGWHRMDRASLAALWCGPILVPRRLNYRKRDYSRASDRERAQAALFREHFQVVEDFITPEECKLILRMARPKWRRSRVGKNIKNGTISTYRTSNTAMLSLEQHEQLSDRLMSRLDGLIPGCAMDRIEQLQCVRYREAQQFKPHLDVSVDDGDSTHRQWTVLVYLNDGFVGGETYFPLLDIKTTPRRGTAVLFRNRDETNGPLVCSMHAGLPVSSGVKYACNIWVKGAESTTSSKGVNAK